MRKSQYNIIERKAIIMEDVDFKIKCWYTCRGKDGEHCKKTCTRYLLMNFFILNCGKANADDYLIPIDTPEKDKEAYDRLYELKDNEIYDYIMNGNNLYICSNELQVGKTTWALKLMYKYFDEWWHKSAYVVRGYFVYVPEFLENMKSLSFKNSAEFRELQTILKTADVVIWDDITNNELTEGEQKILDVYIAQRYMNHKSNIFTGLLPDNFNEQLGKILSARIKKSEIIELSGFTEEEEKEKKNN